MSNMQVWIFDQKVDQKVKKDPLFLRGCEKQYYADSVCVCVKSLGCAEARGRAGEGEQSLTATRLALITKSRSNNPARSRL